MAVTAAAATAGADADAGVGAGAAFDFVDPFMVTSGESSSIEGRGVTGTATDTGVDRPVAWYRPSSMPPVEPEAVGADDAAATVSGGNNWSEGIFGISGILGISGISGISGILGSFMAGI